jgi:hypothetical protein
MTSPFPFTSGDVLTAADLNALSGLVPVKTQTIGSGVSSVTVTDAFSATFDNYRILITDTTASFNLALNMRLGSETGNNYKYLGHYQKWNNSTIVGYGPGTNTYFDSAGRMTTNGSNRSLIDLCSPYQSKPTQGYSNCSGNMTDDFVVTLHLWLDTSDSYTSFSVFPNSGTMTGGTIRVYGYNNG